MMQSQCLNNSIGLFLMLDLQCPKSEVAIASSTGTHWFGGALNFPNVLSEAVKNG